MIFLQLGFLCNAVCLHVLAWHCSNAVTATFSIFRLSLLAPLKKRMGEDRRGTELCGFIRDMDLQHISNQEELVCFLPFFYACRFGEIQGILKCPTMFLMLPSDHKNVFIPITPLLFSIQGLQFRVIQDSLNYCAKFSYMSDQSAVLHLTFPNHQLSLFIDPRKMHIQEENAFT